MNKLLIPALLALATLASPVGARVFTMTYTGTVSNGGYDAIGLFGAAGADLSGASFSAVYTVDDATPGADSFAGKLTPYDHDVTYIRGGYNYVPGVIPVTATLTINGVDFAVSPTDASLASRIDGYRPDYNGYDEVLNYVAGPGQSLFIGLYATGAAGSPDFIQNANYRGTLDFDVVPQIGQTASFNIFINGDPYHLATGQLNVAHLTVAEVAPVPEPAEWAMMLAGLSIVAGVARRRRAG